MGQSIISNDAFPTSAPDAVYFKACAVSERAAARATSDPALAAIHEELAQQYEELVRIIESAAAMASESQRDFEGIAGAQTARHGGTDPQASRR